MSRYTAIYILVEIHPDGSEKELHLGTTLRDGTPTTYTVHGATAYEHMKRKERENPDYRYEIRREWV